MLKFFRKYNTIILVFGGIFLMIAFLLPQAFQQMTPGLSNPPAFRAGGKTFGQVQMTKASQENRVLSETFMPLFGIEGAHQAIVGVQSREHWMMLSLMAERAGLYNPGGTPKDILPRVLNYAGFNVTQQQIDQALESFQNASISARDPRVAQDALRHLDAIISLRQLYGFSNLLSDRELAVFATELYTPVEANLGVISGEAYAKQNLEPRTEAQLVEHWERYRAARPDENPYGFSYRLPDAVKLEVLLIDRGLIEDAIELDPVEVRTFHRQNIENGRYVEDFRAVESMVTRDLRNKKVDEIMEGIRNAVNNLLVQAQSRLERAENGLRKLPEDWATQRPSFERLAEAANEKAANLIETSEPPARVFRYDDEWMTFEDIRLDGTLISLRMLTSAGLTPISNTLFRLPEFEPAQALPETQVGVTIRGISEGISNVRKGDEGFVRVLDIRREGPSESLDQVREDVERDATSLAGYEALEARLDELVSQAAVDDGKVGAVLTLVDEGAYVTTNAIVRYYDVLTGAASRMNVETNSDTEADLMALPLLNYPTFGERVVRHVVDWNPLVDVAQLPIEERVLGVMVPESQSLALVAITNRRPVTQDQMRRLYGSASLALSRRITDENPTLAMMSSLSLEAVEERLGYADLRKDRDEDDAG